MCNSSKNYHTLCCSWRTDPGSHRPGRHHLGLLGLHLHGNHHGGSLQHRLPPRPRPRSNEPNAGAWLLQPPYIGKGGTGRYPPLPLPARLVSSLRCDTTYSRSWSRIFAFKPALWRTKRITSAKGAKRIVSSMSTPDSHHKTQSWPFDEHASPSRKARRDSLFMRAIISLTGSDTSVAHSSRT